MGVRSQAGGGLKTRTEENYSSGCTSDLRPTLGSSAVSPVRNTPSPATGGAFLPVGLYNQRHQTGGSARSAALTGEADFGNYMPDYLGWAPFCARRCASHCNVNPIGRGPTCRYTPSRGGSKRGPKDTLKKAENATVGRAKLLIFHDPESAPPNFSVFP